MLIVCVLTTVRVLSHNLALVFIISPANFCLHFTGLKIRKLQYVKSISLYSRLTIFELIRLGRICGQLLLFKPFELTNHNRAQDKARIHVQKWQDILCESA